MCVYVCYHLYMNSKIYSKVVNITKKKQIYRSRELINGYHWGLMVTNREREGGKGNKWVGD